MDISCLFKEKSSDKSCSGWRVKQSSKVKQSVYWLIEVPTLICLCKLCVVAERIKSQIHVYPER